MDKVLKVLTGTGKIREDSNDIILFLSENRYHL